MLEFYRTYAEGYRNGVLVGTSRVGIGLAQGYAIEEKTSYTLNWDNLNELYCQGIGSGIFSIWDRKKGRQVSFYDFIDHTFDRNFWDIKEWKKPLDIQVHVYKKIYTPSIEEILKWHDGAEASRYMKEHKIFIDRG